jgi:hypothetical protein
MILWTFHFSLFTASENTAERDAHLIGHHILSHPPGGAQQQNTGHDQTTDPA